MIDAILGLNLQAILAALAGLGIIIGGIWARWSGVKAERNKRAKETLDGVAKGQAAVNQGRDSGTPDQRLRNNDGKWP